MIIFSDQNGVYDYLGNFIDLKLGMMIMFEPLQTLIEICDYVGSFIDFKLSLVIMFEDLHYLGFAFMLEAL